MGRSTKEVWAADAAGSLLLYEPENLTIITDPAHPLYDERVHLPLDEALVRSIMAKGVMQPICAVRDPATGRVIVSAGRQRVKALIEANRRLTAEGQPTRKIPVVPRADTLAGAMEVSAAENAIRRDETPLQRAHKMRSMVQHGHDMPGIAQAFGCSEATVESTLLLLQAHPTVQAALAEGAITTGHATKLLKLSPEKQVAAVVNLQAAAAGKTGHAKAKAQREALGANKPAAPGKREIRAAADGLPDGSVKNALLWVLGDREGL